MAYLTTYVLLNGPKQVGKSEIIMPTLVRALEQHFSNVAQDSFAAPMKHFLATALGMKYAQMKKDSPMAILYGYSPREFLIDLSEEYMKKRYGDDVFARLLHYRTLRINPIPAFVVSDDCDFVIERDALPNTVTVRIERPGHDFSGDSRNYLPDHDYLLLNNGSIDELRAKVHHLAAWLIEKRKPRLVE